MRITDFHTHAFPDDLAERAIRLLESEVDDAKAVIPGTLSALTDSMDRHGIARSVICSIATRPAQFGSILAWSTLIASERVIPFPSVHPGAPDAADQIRRIRDAGFRGIKLHPYYQEFDLDAACMWPLYKLMAEQELILVCHTGYDVAFPRYRRADPERIRQVVDRIPELTFVATHLGAWEDWNEVERRLIGSPVYIEISYCLDFLAPGRARALLAEHDPERILFGSDSPWQDQGATLAWFRSLDLGEETELAALQNNADRLLGTSPATARPDR